MENRNSFAPAPLGVEGEDVTTWALPKGAIARFERGGVGDMAFSPDGRHLAVATKIGLWWYEVATMSPLALWEIERGMVSNIAFSPNGKWIAISNWDKVLTEFTCICKKNVTFFPVSVYTIISTPQNLTPSG